MSFTFWRTIFPHMFARDVVKRCEIIDSLTMLDESRICSGAEESARDTGKTEYLHTISKSSSASLNQTILILIKINDPAKARSFKSPPSHDYQHKKNVNCEIFFCTKQTINRPTAMLIITLHFRFSPNWDDYGYR
jgi:hypothetical protein